MKLVVILSALFLLSCSSTVTVNERALTFDKVHAFTMGASTEKEVISSLGSPTSRDENSNYFTLNYVDPKTGYQKFSLNFLSSSGKLSGFLWIPREDEKESSLQSARSIFRNATFREVVMNDNNPHAISADVISYMDEKSGITIRYNQQASVVEAIAVYDVNVSLPASERSKKLIRYSIDDEPVSK